MKKRNSLVLSLFTVVILVGCGGGSSSSSTSPSSTSVSVTKGPLLGATAIDQSGKIGIQTVGTNKYKFEGEISYPIEVTNGYVDVNNNGVIDSGDYEFTGKLSSYSELVTPITTYLGNSDDSDYIKKVEKLKTLTGASEEELTQKDPIETSPDVLALVTSIYETYNVLMDGDDSNDDVSEIDDTELESKFDDYKHVIETSGSEDLEEILKLVEEELKNNTGVEDLDEFDIKKINFSKDDLVGKKLTINNETYYFRGNDVVLGDSGDDYTQFLSYGTTDEGSIKLKFENGDYDVITLTEVGFDISYYGDGITAETVSLIGELNTYTEAELTDVLADNAFIFTNEMISGKEITINDNEGEYEGQFKSDGTYSEKWDDSKSDGTSGTCSGTWTVNSIETGVNITSTCSDNNILESYSLIFNELPVTGSEIKIVSSGEEDETVIITVIDNIDEETSSVTFTLTEDMILNKEFSVTNADVSWSMQFKSGSTYFAEWDVPDGYGVNDNYEYSGECYGIWSFDIMNSNKINISSYCDYGVNDFSITFDETPVVDSIINLDYTSDAKIDIVSNIGVDTSSFTLTHDLLSGKKMYIDDNGNSSILEFSELYGFNKYIDDSENSTCYGDWMLNSSKSNIVQLDYICSGESFKPNGAVEPHYTTIYISVDEELKKGSTITYTDGDESKSLILEDFTNIIVSNKIFTISDESSSVVLEFAPNGYHAERSDTSSCSGYWADLGNNKFGMTCQDGGTEELPNGVVDENSNEIIIEFNSSSPEVNDMVTITDADGSHQMTIDLINNY